MKNMGESINSTSYISSFLLIFVLPAEMLAFSASSGLPSRPIRGTKCKFQLRLLQQKLLKLYHFLSCFIMLVIITTMLTLDILDLALILGAFSISARPHVLAPSSLHQDFSQDNTVIYTHFKVIKY